MTRHSAHRPIIIVLNIEISEGTNSVYSREAGLRPACGLRLCDEPRFAFFIFHLQPAAARVRASGT